MPNWISWGALHVHFRQPQGTHREFDRADIWFVTSRIRKTPNNIQVLLVVLVPVVHSFHHHRLGTGIRVIPCKNKGAQKFGQRDAVKIPRNLIVYKMYRVIAVVGMPNRSK
jgi:hypothetical protein